MKRNKHGRPERMRATPHCTIRSHSRLCVIQAPIDRFLHAIQDDRVSGAWGSMLNPQSTIRTPQSIMPPFLFWTFALLMLVFGVAVVVNRNPVASALGLVVSFLGLAALFMSLDAYFIGIIQVLVYAGAVMVLFLFIIMLLDLRAEEE